MAQEENKQETAEQRPFLRRGEDFESLYANHVYLIPSEWDLKMIFGEVDNDDKGSFIEQHTAIAIPWLQAKILHYFLSLQLGFYEINHGKISIPLSIQPPEPDPIPEELSGNDGSRLLYELVRAKRAELLAP